MARFEEGAIVSINLIPIDNGWNIEICRYDRGPVDSACITKTFFVARYDEIANFISQQLAADSEPL